MAAPRPPLAAAAADIGARVARTPPPPDVAVIFTSQRQGEDEGYGVTADRMVELAAQQPGFLGVERARDAEGLGITVSYWLDEASVRAWKVNVEHADARQQGRERWYERYALRVARVERAYGSALSIPGSEPRP
jgi:heme-degrading monooxygenase HmoA